MNRRNFLSNTAAFTVPLMLHGVPVFANGGAYHPFFNGLTPPPAGCGKVLIIIQLNGGNDGLNMVLPLDRYSQLSQARASILMPSTSVLPLTGTTTTGLHPAMTGLRDLYNVGKVNLIQGVSYPNPNYSHFQAQDIWFSGTPTLPVASTGWLGRQLDAAYPGYPTGYPNTTAPDPLSIQIGGVLPLSLQGPAVTMAYNAPNPDALINVATATPAPAPNSDYGTELTFLRLMKDQSNAYTSSISVAYNAQPTLSTMYPAPGTSSLADQLKVVARLIGGGLTTPVYVVNHDNSFDTHVDQIDPSNSNHTTGYHANILSLLSVAISAFQNDITLMGKANKVTGMTYSEFGRRVISNASNGTDHGAGAPIIFFGAAVNGGITGSSPILPAISDANTQVPLQYDYRQIYATVIQQWFCMTPAQSQTLLGGSFATIPLFSKSALPIEAINLTAFWKNDFVQLNFEVIENEIFDNFNIERSTDGTNFSFVNAVTNNTASINQTYQYADVKINAAAVYYRVKGTTKQGKIIYSSIVILRNNKIQQLSVYPNPVTNNTIFINFYQTINENVSITIYGTLGEKLYYNQLNPNGRPVISFRVPNSFNAKTIYILNIRYSGGDINEKLLFD